MREMKKNNLNYDMQQVCDSKTPTKSVNTRLRKCRNSSELQCFDSPHRVYTMTATNHDGHSNDGHKR